jgi:hypothetical protein
MQLRKVSASAVLRVITLTLCVRVAQICNHPYLLEGVEDREEADGLRHSYVERVVAASGKMILLDKVSVCSCVYVHCC